jgi:hypothetical protein
MSGSVIFALDGVLANHEYRRVPERKTVHWREEFEQIRIEEDTPSREVVRLCQQLRENSTLATDCWPKRNFYIA